MELHTEKRTAPFVATQIIPTPKAYEIRACAFTKGKNARLRQRGIKFVWLNYSIIIDWQIQGN